MVYFICFGGTYLTMISCVLCIYYLSKQDNFHAWQNATEHHWFNYTLFCIVQLSKNMNSTTSIAGAHHFLHECKERSEQTQATEQTSDKNIWGGIFQFKL